jgi:hypothetical protein
MPSTATKRAEEHRPLSEIAREIKRDWINQTLLSAKTDKFYAARPYLNAMLSMDQITEQFYADSGLSVVLYFLSNSASWRGETARRIKAELKAIVRSTGYKL